MSASPQPPPSGGRDARPPEVGATRGPPGEAARLENLDFARDEAAEAMARKLAREAARWEQRRAARGDDGQA
jgi:hypothetical protein